MEKEPANDDSRRYYPTPMEQSVLLKHITQYFSYPERSVERNKVAADVSAILVQMSPHWTHRAVRLWFNNNRNSYKADGPNSKRQPMVRFPPNDPQLNSSNTNQIPGIIPPSPMSPGYSPTFIYPNKPISPIPQNYEQNLAYGLPPNPNLNPNLSHNLNSINPNIPPNIKPPISPTPNSNLTPVMQPAYNPTMSPTFKPNMNPPLNQPINSNLTPSITQPMTTPINTPISPTLAQPIAPPIPPPINPPLNPALNQKMASPANINPSPTSNQNVNQTLSQPVASPMNQNVPKNQNASTNSNGTDESNQSTQEQNIQWQGTHQSTHTLYQVLTQYAYLASQAQNELTAAQYIPKFDQYANAASMKGSTRTIDYSKLNCSIVSFPYIDAADLSEPLGFHLESDLHLSREQSPLLQNRSFSDIPTGPFDSTFADNSSIAFVHNLKFSPEREISYRILSDSSSNALENKDIENDWYTIPLGFRERIESVVIDPIIPCAWLLPFSHENVYRQHLFKIHKKSKSKAPESMSVPKASFAKLPTLASSIGNIAIWRQYNSVIIPNDRSPSLYIIDSRMKVRTIECQVGVDNGIDVVLPYRNNIVCSLKNSHVLRLVSEIGQEISSFFGHLEHVMFLEAIDDNTFVSASDDRTLNIWDYRQRIPSIHISTNKRSIVALTASPGYVIYSNHAKQLCSIDIRMTDAPKALLCVSTNEYNTTSINYDANSDSLHMFGVASKEGNSDSLLFMDDNGTTRKYIYRKYSPFLQY